MFLGGLECVAQEQFVQLISSHSSICMQLNTHNLVAQVAYAAYQDAYRDAAIPNARAVLAACTRFPALDDCHMQCTDVVVYFFLSLPQTGMYSRVH